jgi:hypothetical protein
MMKNQSRDAPGLWHDLSCLIPCTVIVILGVINNSYTAIGTGLFVYLLFWLRSTLYQMKQLPMLISILSKLETAAKTADEDESSRRE